MRELVYSVLFFGLLLAVPVIGGWLGWVATQAWWGAAIGGVFGLACFIIAARNNG